MESGSAALANIAVASNDSDLASHHDVGCTLDAVDQALSAAVQVVKLALCDGVIDVDRWSEEPSLLALVLEHLVQMMHTCCCLLGDAVAALQLLWVLLVHEGSEVTTIVEDDVEVLA